MMKIFKKILSVLLIFTYYSVFAYTPITFAQDVPAPDFACGIDKNADGSYDSEGEYSTCLKRTNIFTQDPSHSCPAGYTLSGSICTLKETSQPTLTCPTGYTKSGEKCTLLAYAPSKKNTTPFTCNNPSHPVFSLQFRSVKYTGRGQLCLDTEAHARQLNDKYACGLYNNVQGDPCSAGMDLFIKNGWLVFYNNNYCDKGWTLEGNQCTQNITSDAQLVCPPGYVKTNNTCVKTTNIPDVVSCPSGYTLANNKCSKTEQSIVCPLGNVDCIDLNKNTPVDDGNIDGKTLVDDGKKSDEGVCLDQIYIFSGRASDCKLAGVSTAFKNCCKSEGKVYSDDAAPAMSVIGAARYVKDIYGAAMEAYEYYTVAMQATADAAVASSMAADAFVDALMATVNPASIAISIAVHFVMQYLMKACDQMSMETAMEAGSGMCHEVGTYCKKRIPLLGCVQKAKSYCCFNSILARIIQEQGRPQLTTLNGWGEPESPQCRGFTPEEFQSIDFAKIDLSEYVESMVTKATSEIQNEVTDITKSFYDKTN